MYSKDGEPILDADGNQVMRTVYPTAAELSAANAFLKQNNITAAPQEDDGLAELQKQLAQQRKRRAPVMPDFDADLGIMQ